MGEVTHFFPRIRVCVIKITGGVIRLRDKLLIRGRSTNFIQVAQSIQIENENVKEGRKGQLIGLKMDKPVNAGDKVYKFEK